jgi:hypothetical protein
VDQSISQQWVFSAEFSVQVHIQLHHHLSKSIWKEGSVVLFLKNERTDLMASLEMIQDGTVQEVSQDLEDT